MPDPRWDRLAEILLNHSTKLQAGETVLIECFDLEDDTLPRLIARKAAFRGANALIDTKQARSIALHQRYGFEQVGHLREVGFKFGRWLDVVYLQKMLI